jgi:hypothetical protein
MVAAGSAAFPRPMLPPGFENARISASRNRKAQAARPLPCSRVTTRDPGNTTTCGSTSERGPRRRG